MLLKDRGPPLLRFRNVKTPPQKKFCNILPINEKIPKWTPKNFENLSTGHKFYFDWVQKDIMVELKYEFGMDIRKGTLGLGGRSKL